MTKEAVKKDDGKAELDLLPGDALAVVARVLTFGAKKYAKNNWLLGMKWSRLIAAALRHTFSAAGGEWLDPESGLPHLAHACCCLLFLLSYDRRKLGMDDVTGRPADSVPSDHNKPTLGIEKLFGSVSTQVQPPVFTHAPRCGMCYCIPCMCDVTLKAHIKELQRRELRGDTHIITPPKGGNDVPT